MSLSRIKIPVAHLPFYSSEKITDCPSNTHSCRNSKCKQKSIPTICQGLHGVSLHDAVHTVVERASGNQWDYRSNEKGSGSFLTDPGKDFCIQIRNKSSQKSRQKNTSPYGFPNKKNQPAKKSACAGKGQIFAFHMEEHSKGNGAHSSCDQLNDGLCIQSPNLPNKRIAPINPSASAAARSRAAISRMMPDRVSPMRTSRMALVDISPGIRSIMSPIIILSI